MTNTSPDGYRLIDSGNFEKLEQVGPYLLVRPSPQAVWAKNPAFKSQWSKWQARFERHTGGGGAWQFKGKRLAKEWQITVADIAFVLQATDFGHLGIFAEQQDNWQRFPELIAKARKAHPQDKIKVLNLFAYTGGSSLACARAGAEVAHVDASKTTVAWARRNGELNDSEAAPIRIRWLVDDAKKFVQREINRGNRYHGIILDPPTFGRGNKGEVWKIEEDLLPLMAGLKELMADGFCFVSLSSHSPGYTPAALTNILAALYKPSDDVSYLAEEMLVRHHPSQNPNSSPSGHHKVAGSGLPSGATCLAVRS